MGLPPEVRRKYNYGIFSARTGNIYTTKLLLQWLQWAFGTDTPPEEVWEHQGRYYDPFRPAIEPDGFESPEELLASRGATTGLRGGPGADPLAQSGCAGAAHGVAGAAHRDGGGPARAGLDHLFQVGAARGGGRGRGGGSGSGLLPSYEIITAPVYRGMFYDPNARTISLHGVAHVMEQFMAGLAGTAPPEEAPAPEAAAAEPRPAAEPGGEEADDLKCEEAMLEAFAPGQ